MRTNRKDTKLLVENWRNLLNESELYMEGGDTISLAIDNVVNEYLGSIEKRSIGDFEKAVDEGLKEVSDVLFRLEEVKEDLARIKEELIGKDIENFNRDEVREIIRKLQNHIT